MFPPDVLQFVSQKTQTQQATVPIYDSVPAVPPIQQQAGGWGPVPVPVFQPQQTARQMAGVLNPPIALPPPIVLRPTRQTLPVPSLVAPAGSQRPELTAQHAQPAQPAPLYPSEPSGAVIPPNIEFYISVSGVFGWPPVMFVHALLITRVLVPALGSMLSFKEFVVAAVSQAQGPPSRSDIAPPPPVIPAPVELPAFLNELLQAGAIKLPGATASGSKPQSWPDRQPPLAAQRNGADKERSNGFDLPQVTYPVFRLSGGFLWSIGCQQLLNGVCIMLLCNAFCNSCPIFHLRVVLSQALAGVHKKACAGSAGALQHCSFSACSHQLRCDAYVGCYHLLAGVPQLGASLSRRGCQAHV